MPEPWLAMGVVAGAYLAMFGAGEVACRYGSVGPDVTRKLGHIGAGAIALGLPLLFSSVEPVIALAVAFVVFLTATRAAGRLGSIHAIERRSSGAFVYPVAIAIVFAIAADDYPVYAIAVLALAIGDAVGGIVGGRWGAHAYAAWGQAKTWEGSLAVLGTVIVISLAVLLLDGRGLGEALSTALLVGLVVTAVEGALPWGIDNLGIPIAAILAIEVTGTGSTPFALGLAAVAGALLAIAVGVSRAAATGSRSAAAELDARGD